MQASHTRSATKIQIKDNKTKYIHNTCMSVYNKSVQNLSHLANVNKI